MHNSSLLTVEVLKAMETFPACIAVLSTDFVIVTASELYLKVAETTIENIQGKIIFDAFPDNPDTPSANSVKNLQTSLLRVLSSKKPHQMMVQRYDIPDVNNPGEFLQRYWEPINSPVLNHNNEVEYIIHMVSNVTDRMIAQTDLKKANDELSVINEQLLESNRQLSAALKELQHSQTELEKTNSTERESVQEALKYRKALLEAQNEAIPDAILIVDTKGKMLSFNKHFVSLWGIPKDIIEQRDDTSALEYAMTQLVDPEGFIERVNYCYTHPDIVANEEVQFKDGRIIQRYGNAVIGEDGFFYGWAWYFRDITITKELEKQKDDFISIASHELKTPITSLKASLQIMDRLRTNPSGASFDNLLEHCNKSMGKITTLIDDLLNVSRMNHGQLQLKQEHFKVSDLLTSCCDHVRMDGKYNLIFKGDESLVVYADRDKIEQVVVNFVNNAIKYAPDSLDILLIAEDLGNKAKISVTDFGNGIEPDKTKRLFDRYYRADVAGHQNSGLGLGLFICSEIIKKHGGTIGAESELGKGSTFWFIINKS